MNLLEILNSSLPIIRKTSEFILSQVDQVSADDIEVKELNSLVSYVDKEAENMLVSGLAEILPNAGFITEEETENVEGKRYTWIIDPLDGTTNFLNKIPHFAISVALRMDDEIVLGVVKEINSGEEWTAIVEKGAHLNGNQIHVSTKPFESVTIATGFPYSNDGDYDAKFKVLKHWLVNTNGVRRMGSAALDLCYVACGRFGAYYESSLNTWDVAAGALIVIEAGGKVSDFDGGDTYISGKEILASAPNIYSEVFHNVSKNFK